MASIPAFSELNKRQQMAVLIGVPVLAVIVIGWFTNRALARLGPDPKLWSLVHRVQPGNVWEDINSKQTQIDEKNLIIAEGPKIEATIKALEDDIKEAEQRLPTEAEKADMRQLIEKLAREIPADIGIVRYKSVKITEGARNAPGGRGGADYQQIVYTTEIEGDLNGIIKYVDSLEKNPRFMTVRSFTLKPGDMKLNEDKTKVTYALHQVTMDVVTYVYTPAKKRPQ
jgi:hypothetical protein